MLSSEYLQGMGNMMMIHFIFYIGFYCFFNLLFLLFFIVIILWNYEKLKKKVELTANALARITANQSKATTQKWLNLIFMKPPLDKEDETNKKQEIPCHSDQC